MAKTDTFVCTECGWSTARWVGRCGECQAWGSVVEQGAPKLTDLKATTPTTKALPIAQVGEEQAERRLTGISELDRVLGGGLVSGAVVLLAGEPGVGKSTLLLEVAARWARDSDTLYISGEESAAQVRLRASRTNGLADRLYLASETDLGALLGHVNDVNPSLLVVDSIQTIGVSGADGVPGGVSQVREVTGALVRTAKQRGMSVVIVGHVTKEGSIAGPRTMEHLVDVVLNFDGDRHSGFRTVRAVKNRFGPSDEVGCFEMVDSGIAEVTDPSGLFLTEHTEAVPGTCVTVSLEGRRPMLAEVQALVAPSPGGSPRRTTNGVDSSRVAMILAVLERRLGMPLAQHDVYVATVGGVKITDPAADLAIATAVASAFRDYPAPAGLVALGEIGLAGELRRVPGVERRLAEAARLGMQLAYVPTGSRDKSQKLPRLHDLKVIERANVASALSRWAAGRPPSGEEK